VKNVLPNGPMAPAIVQSARMLMDPHGWMEQCHRRYGDVFTVRISGRPPVVMVSEPEAVRWILTQGYGEMTRYAEEARYMLGDHSILLQQDEVHECARKVVATPFHGDAMRAYAADIARTTDEQIAGWRNGEQRQLHAELEDISLRVILRCVFGISEEQRLTTLRDLILEYLHVMMSPTVFAATLLLTGHRVRAMVRKRMQGGRRPRWLPSGPWSRAARCLAAIEDILATEVRACRSSSHLGLPPRHDILSWLANGHFGDHGETSDEIVRDHLLTLLLAGYETTATALAWAVHCMIGHPSTWERAREEVRAVMPNGFDPRRVKELSYISAIVSESMRLYPIASQVTRQLKVDATLAGHRLPAGTFVCPSIYLVQRDPRVWHAPDEFRPERFLSGRAPIYRFFPFGAGVWRCVGAQFAEHEMRTVLARLVAQVELEQAPDVRIRPVQHGITVAPSDGLPCTVWRLEDIAAAAAPSAAAPSPHPAPLPCREVLP